VVNSLILDTNKNFQLATSIVGLGESGPGPSPPLWSTASEGVTLDFQTPLTNGITWTNISPAVVSTAVTANVVTIDLSFYAPLVIGSLVTLYNLGTSTFLNGVPLTVASISGNTITAGFAHSQYATTPESTGTATFALPTPINNIQYQALSTQWKTLYQQQYTNTNCTSGGITDTLRIFVQQVEQPPLNDMLIVAPVLNPNNANTTIAAWGDTMALQLTPAQWAALPRIFVNITSAFADGKNATYMYVPAADPATDNSQFLHEGELVTITSFASGSPLNVTAKIRDVINTVAQVSATSVSGDTLTVTTVSNIFTPGNLVNLNGLASSTFLNAQQVIVLTAGPTFFTAAFTHADYATTPDTGTAEVTSFQIPMPAVVPLTTAPTPALSGLVSPVLQAGYYLSGGNYVLGQPPIAVSGTGIGESWVPGGSVFQGQIIVDSNGFTQLALNAGTSQLTPNPTWSEDLNQPTDDGNVVWRNVGRNTFTVPQRWIMLLQGPTDFTTRTGEVGNWDATMPYGLLAPRLDQVWEISGGDQDFIFGLN